MKLATSTILNCPLYPFVLNIKMCWAKNIWTERELLMHILLALRNWHTFSCTLQYSMNVLGHIRVGCSMFGTMNQSFCPHCKNPFKPILQASYSSGGIGNPLHLQRSSYIVQPQWNTKGLDSAMTSLKGPEKTSWHWFHNPCACKVFGVEDARVRHYHSFRQHTSSTFLFRDMKFQLSALIWLREPRLLWFVLEEHPM